MVSSLSPVLKRILRAALAGLACALLLLEPHELLRLRAVDAVPRDAEARLAQAVFTRVKDGGSFRYAVNPVTGSALWCAEHLTRADLVGGGERPGNFHGDPNLPRGLRTADANYTNEIWDRGHLLSDRNRGSGEAKYERANTSNVIPQHPVCNRGLGRLVEQAIRDLLVDDDHELDLVAVPLYAYRSQEPLWIGAQHVFVPTHVALVALVYRRGEPVAMPAWILPNDDCKGATVAGCRVPPREIEDRAQLDLFPWLPDPLEDRLETAR